MTTTLNRLWGAWTLDALFPEDRPRSNCPFPSIGRPKSRALWDEKAVHTALRQTPLPLSQVDPRGLVSLQPNVTRAGVQHYLGGAQGLYADAHQAGNRHPVVYRHQEGFLLLLSGTHRAVAALLRGEPLEAVVVKGGYGEPYRAFRPVGPSDRA